MNKKYDRLPAVKEPEPRFTGIQPDDTRSTSAKFYWTLVVFSIAWAVAILYVSQQF